MAVYWGIEDSPTYNGVPYNQLYSNNNIYDTVYIHQTQLPGICKVDAKIARRVDQKKPIGVNGSTFTINGRDPASVKIDVIIWTAQQYEALINAINIVYPYKGMTHDAIVTDITTKDATGKTLSTKTTIKNPPKPIDSALDIYHPFLADLGIDSIIILEVGSLKDGPCVGAKMMTITAVEYMPSAKHGKQTITQKAPSSTNVPMTQASSVLQSDPTRPHNAVSSPPSFTDAGPNQSLPSGASGTY